MLDSIQYCYDIPESWNNCEGTVITNNANAPQKYEGEFKDGSFHGQGTYTWTKSKYVGEWEDCKRHGEGAIVYDDGRIKVGKYNQDYCKLYDTCHEYEGLSTIKEAQLKREAELKADREAKLKAVSKKAAVITGRVTNERKSKEIEQANDNIRIALDALNYTFEGNKKERTIIVLDAENCIFEKDTWFIAGKQYDKFYLNNVIFDTIKFYNKRYYNDAFGEWMDAILISFSGDEKVFYHGGFQSENNEYEGVVSDSAELERVQKAWGVIYSKACKGASAGEF